METFKNLAPKIRSIRKQLGLKQEELATRLQVSRPLVALWESNLIKNRVTPSPEKLIALTQLTQKPWWTMLWFMDDELDSTVGVDYFPDGTKITEPSWEDSDVERMLAEISARDNAPPEDWLKEIVVNSDKLFELKTILSDPQRQNIKRPPPPRTVANGLIARRPPTVWDVAGIEGERQNAISVAAEVVGHNPTEFGDEEMHDAARHANFWGAVKWNLESAQRLVDVSHYFEARTDCGVIKLRLGYFDTKNAIDFLQISPTTEIPAVRHRLTRAIGNLFTFEKVKGKTYRKMIVIYTQDSFYDEKKLKNVFSDLINSVSTLGISTPICLGPVEVATKMREFITAKGTWEP
jgi:transcriptional regulator with XRE-family HTH domain